PLLHQALLTSTAIALASATLALAIALPAVVVPRTVLAAGDADAFPARPLGAALAAICSLILLVPPVVVATGWFLVLRAFGDTGRYAPAIIVTINALMALPFVYRVLDPAYRTHLARTGRLAL